MSRPPPTAASYGPARLPYLRAASRAPRRTGDERRCPRCGAHLHFRKPDSIARTWALLIAAMILYIPANVLPIMHTSSLFGSQSDTIMSGVVYFWTSGSWYLALIVFIASIMVPLLKMIALMLLLISVQRRSRWQLEAAGAALPAGGSSSAAGRCSISTWSR